MVRALSPENTADLAAWNAFVQAHPEGRIFHSPEYFQLLESEQSYFPFALAACEENGKIQALIQGAVHRQMGGMLAKVSSRAVIWGGVLVAENQLSALKPLLAFYDKEIGGQVIYTEVRNPFETAPIRAEMEKG